MVVAGYVALRAPAGKDAGPDTTRDSVPSNTLMLLLPKSATARSARPSPLKSPTTRPRGNIPAGNGLPLMGLKPPLPLPDSTVTLALGSLVTAKSALPSPLKSPTASEVGPNPTENGLPDASVKPPRPSPNKTVTLLLIEFATARSALPSPLKSPITIEFGMLPVDGLTEAAAKRPPPSPNRMVTLLLFSFATATSGIPSPLKSPTTREAGLFPTALGPPGDINPPRPSPSSTVTLLVSGSATIRSAYPSPLKSPTLTEESCAATARGLEDAAVKPPLPFPSSTVMLLS